MQAATWWFAEILLRETEGCGADGNMMPIYAQDSEIMSEYQVELNRPEGMFEGSKSFRK